MAKVSHGYGTHLSQPRTVMNAIEFFQMSEGIWRSHRITHHLLLRRSESGNTEIEVKVLAPDDPKVIEICQLHTVQPEQAIGGCFVQWKGTMAWDRDEEDTHQGSTVFVLVPDNRHSGQLLRERGYAENIPVIGQYQVDAHNGLVLTTEYDTMSSQERFWFANPNLRLRTTTVKSLGGFNTTSFCAESKLSALTPPSSPATTADALIPAHSWLGW
ncbi:phycobiliprotein lyase [Acaryochloris sp. IP29b_bin.148]|uniref:phycobiliprotein lyase n=1 Tax=Acaryochloris sp. IP29b_bin.148 TaxID=2969218 RepID=UPI002621BC51|nr:phycobiliprotein lyase [Acaryochloris sp. IP29b_bin.148]